MHENPRSISSEAATSVDKNTMYDLLRDALIYERKSLRMSLRELSRVIGCSRSALSEFENGSSKTSAIIIFKYAAAVGLEIYFSTKDDFRLIDPHSHDIRTSENPHPSEVQ